MDASARSENLKTLIHILAALAFPLLLAAGFSGCGQEGADGSSTVTQAPLTPQDLLINDYEKTANQFVKTARKMKGGDVSLTIRYIDLSKEMRAWPAKLQAQAGKMSPSQSQRVAGISAKAAPYLQK